MKRKIRKAACAAPFLFGPVAASAQSGKDFPGPRDAAVNAAGARTVSVEAGMDGAKSVRITDGSGQLVISNVRGDARTGDGYGDSSPRNVSGSFTVETDGYGGIFATDIQGAVVVERDGSVEINHSRVGGDFTV